MVESLFEFFENRRRSELTFDLRFFETEGIAILTMLISKYKIEIKEEPQFAAETFEERKARVLKCRGGLTLT